jgi:hypothetical protein
MTSIAEITIAELGAVQGGLSCQTKSNIATYGSMALGAFLGNRYLPRFGARGVEGAAYRALNIVFGTVAAGSTADNVGGIVCAKR